MASRERLNYITASTLVCLPQVGRREEFGESSVCLDDAINVHTDSTDEIYPRLPCECNTVPIGYVGLLPKRVLSWRYEKHHRRRELGFYFIPVKTMDKTKTTVICEDTAMTVCCLREDCEEYGHE